MKLFLSKLFPESFKRKVRITRSIYGSIYYRFPSKGLKLIGVTGTSGKSTTANLIYHVLKENGFKVGVISTVNAMAGNKSMDTGFHVTTPEPVQFHKILRFMKDRDIEYVIVETSSHALEQGRLGLTKFEHAVFTNIKRDHLDWHKTWENYARSKSRLIDMTKKGGKIVINRGDKESYEFLSAYTRAAGRANDLLTYSRDEVTELTETVIGTKFTHHNTNYQLPILGAYNVDNALAAIEIGKILGLTDDQINLSLKTFMGLEGRMQIMQPAPFAVIVDFAHNTDSLVKSLQTARSIADTRGRVITVFGSAGLRDVEKRYTMGEAGAEYADIVVITAEDPRTESLYDINSQIIEGAERKEGKLVKRFASKKEMDTYLLSLSDVHFDINNRSVFAFDEESVDSRYNAIEFAIRIAKKGDVVITEGKGHEQSLCFGLVEYPFTDQEAVEKVLGNAQV